MKFNFSKKLFFIALIFSWGTLLGVVLVGLGLYLLTSPLQTPLFPGVTSIVDSIGKVPLMLGIGYGVGLLLYSIRSALSRSVIVIAEPKIESGEI